MTLAELLGHEALGLRNRTPRLDVGRVLEDVRLLELPEEALGLHSGGLALSTGLWMGRKPERQLEFAEALTRCGVVALGLRTGVVVPRLPDALVRACQDQGIVAFEVPPTVTLESVARHVSAGWEVPLEVALRDLVSGLEAGGETGMLERLEQLVRTPVVLFAPWGHPMHCVGEADPMRLWNAISHPGDADRIVEAVDGILQSFTVRLEGRTRAVLIAATPDLGRAGRIRPTLEFARQLLEVSAPGRREPLDQERLVRGGLLRELLLEPWDAALSPARLEAFGFDHGEPLALAVVEVHDAWARGRTSRISQLEFRRFLDDLRRAGEEHFQSLGAPFLTGTLSSTALFAWQTRTPQARLESLRAAILAAVPDSDVRLGVSAPHPTHDLPGAHREAHFAARAVLEPRGAQAFAQMDALSWVAATGPDEAMRAVVDATLGAIRAHDPGASLEQTVRVYLEQDRNQTKTARLLGIHLNTLRYRLKRIEGILGASVDATQMLGRLQLALIAARRFE